MPLRLQISFLAIPRKLAKNRPRNEELVKIQFFRYLMAVASELGNAEKATFRDLKRHSKLQLFLLFFSSPFFLFWFPKNLEYILEEVDLGSRTLFSLEFSRFTA